MEAPGSSPPALEAARSRLEACVSAEQPLEVALRAVVEQARHFVAGTSSSVVLLDPRTHELVFVALEGAEGRRSLSEHRFPAELGITGHVIRTGIGALVNDPASDPRFYPGVAELAELRTENILVVPLRFEGRVIGAIDILNKPGGFTDQDLELAERFSHLASDAVGRSTRRANALRRGGVLECTFEGTVEHLTNQSSTSLVASPELRSLTTAALEPVDAPGSSDPATEDEAPSLWRNPRFVALIASAFVSHCGSGITHIAVLWLAYELTQSAASTGAVFVCLTLPGVVAGPLAGALADRYPKRRLLLVSRFASAVVVLGFWLAWQQGSVAVLYATVLLIGVGVSFVNGPMQAYLPDVFESHRLPAVNSAFQSGRSLATLVGPAIGGVILATGRVEIAFVVDSMSFVLSGLLLLLLPSIQPKLQKGAVTLGALHRDMLEGFRYVAGSPMHRFLLLFFIPLCGLYCLTGGLIMPYADQLLAGQHGVTGSTALSAIYAVIGFGGFVGSFFIPSVMRRLGPLRAMIVGAVLSVAELLVFGAVPVLGVLLAVLVVTASSFPLLLVPLFTLMQQHTPEEFAGRAMGAMDTLLLATISLAFGIGGVLADRIGLQPMFIASAVAVALLTVAVLNGRGYRALRRLEA